MAIRRCRWCQGTLRGDPVEIGARCPHCRRPLYERPEVDDGTPFAEPVEQDHCALHATGLAIGTCPRCGNFLCEVCRTRWQGRYLCVACVERALAAGEANPDEERAHRRQAILSVVFGVLTWVLVVLGVLVLATAREVNEVALGFIIIIFFLGGLAGAILGLAQGAAAIRARGDHLILATAGLLLSGLYAGMFIGMLGVSFWQE